MYKIVIIWLKLILGFIFSMSVMLLIISYSLSGTVADDTLEIIVTEATGLQQQEVMLSIDLQPLMILNLVWFSILVLGFCIIFLYFLERSLKTLLPPGFLALVSVGFMQIIFAIIRGYVPPEEQIETTGYVFQTLERADQVSLIVVMVGIALMLISYFGYVKWEKPRKEQRQGG